MSETLTKLQKQILESLPFDKTEYILHGLHVGVMELQLLPLYRFVIFLYVLEFLVHSCILNVTSICLFSKATTQYDELSLSYKLAS